MPYTVSCLPEVYVQRWLVWPWQSHSWVCVPLAVAAFGTSTHRPDWPPTSVTLCCGPPGGGELLEGGVDGPDWNWVKKLHTTALVQERSPGS
ncbi:hypothetical protein GCM10027610_031460 [Dactylosporangium cerinum]